MYLWNRRTIYWNYLSFPLFLPGTGTIFTHRKEGPSSSWLYGSCIYNYLCYPCLSPLMLWVWISLGARCTTLYDKVCQWLESDKRFSLVTPAFSTNKTDRHNITEILLKVVLNTIKPTPKTHRKGNNSY
jgi:hypothetical protein